MGLIWLVFNRSGYRDNYGKTHLLLSRRSNLYFNPFTVTDVNMRHCLNTIVYEWYQF